MKFFKGIFTISFFFVFGFVLGQSTDYSIHKLPSIKKLGTVDVSSLDDKYLPHLKSIEAPHVSGNKYKEHLNNVKEKVHALYPKNNNKISLSRSYVNPPEILNGYQVTGIQTGSPIDNHLAMADKYIVTAGNFYMAITNEAGGTYKKFSLTAFANAAGVTSQPFDPRLAYDPEADRFIFTFLAGFDSQNTDIIIAFSETNDPRSRWNIYNITGNPNNLAEWTDYPMLALTKDDVFLTINLLRDNESWQDGFVETIIWQIDKQSGYDGVDLAINKWDDIRYDGMSIRNLCPAESATEELYDEMYFVSNRNFSMENDSFFLVNISSATNPNLDIQVFRADQAYGAPPNAAQKKGNLATNDARVLEAFRLNDHIQFVGNTRNPINNSAGIYHGIIREIKDQPFITLNHIVGDDFEIGYPGITYMGDGFFEEDAILNFNHSSINRFPGTSALYSIPDIGYSDIITLSEGENFVDMNSGQSQRWGDYSGSQRNFNNPERVWVCGYFGTSNNVNAPYVSELAKPQIPTGTYEIDHQFDSKVYPNPAEDRLTLQLDVPQGVNELTFLLYNINGQFLDELYSTNLVKAGKNEFSINTSVLVNGTYLIKAISNQAVLTTHTFIK